MRKLSLFLLFSIAVVTSFSQSTPSTLTRSSGTNVVVDARLEAGLNLYTPRYLDTTAANFQKGRDSCGALIYTYTGNRMWKRSCNPKAWVAMESAGGLQEITDINRRSTHSIEVNGFQTNDSLKSISPLIIGAPNWVATDSSNYPFSRMGPNQGIAWDGNYRYLDSNSVIYKVDANYNILWANRNPFSGLDSTDHMGDFFFNKTDGHLYVPMETINTTGNVFSGQKIGIFDTTDGHRISVITASDKHPSEITALTKYDSSIAAIDFYVGGTIFLRSFTDASVIDSIDLATPIPGAQGITFDSTKRVFNIVSETKLYSVKEDGSEVLELMTLPYSNIGHVGEGLEMINGSLSMLVASRGNSLSKVYTVAPSTVSPTYVIRASIDGNGDATLKKASSEFLTLASSGANKVTLSHPSSLALGGIQFDKNAFYLDYNGIYGTKFIRQDSTRASFAFVMSGKDSSFQFRVSRKSAARKVTFDKAVEISADGATYIKPSAINVEHNNQVLAPLHVTTSAWRNFRDSLNPIYTLADFQHDTTASMLRMQNTGVGGSTFYWWVTNNANSSSGKKVVGNFSNSTSSPLLTIDSVTQSFRIKNHIGVGTALNVNPSGLGTVSLSVSDLATDGRPQLDLIGNRNSADQTQGQLAFYGNATRIATVSALRGSNSTSGYLKFSTTSSGTLTDRMTITESGNIGIGTTTPNSKAALDIPSTTQGVLIPRLTTVQRDAITSPATWLMLVCTDCTAVDGSTGVLQIYNGSTWKNAW